MCRLLILKIHTDTEMISSAAHWFTSVLGTVNREYSERETKKMTWLYTISSISTQLSI